MAPMFHLTCKLNLPLKANVCLFKFDIGTNYTCIIINTTVLVHAAPYILILIEWHQFSVVAPRKIGENIFEPV